MKDQYFGDVNDYRKYAILQQLSCAGSLRAGICWMLTETDHRTDGQAIGYLQRPDVFRPFAPELYDFLHRTVVVDQVRRVTRIEDSGLLPNTVFYSTLLQDSRHARDVYFAGMEAAFTDAGLIFFDPDNGLEVASIPKGRKGSSKYLYFDEVVRTFALGRSVLIYQHFPRKPRGPFISLLAEALAASTGSNLILSFQTSRVVFLLVSQRKHEQHFLTVASRSATLWERGKIVVGTHRVPHN